MSCQEHEFRARSISFVAGAPISLQEHQFHARSMSCVPGACVSCQEQQFRACKWPEAAFLDPWKVCKGPGRGPKLDLSAPARSGRGL